MPLDISVKDGTIVGLNAPGAELNQARAYLDATSKLVVPGGIDPHVHCDWPVHDPRTGTQALTAGPDIVSAAALCGGTTTLVDFATVGPEDDLLDAVAAKEATWNLAGHCDYGLHILLQGRLSPAVLGQASEAVESGYVSLKVFTTNIWPRLTGRRIDFGSLWELLQLSADKQAVIAVHAEDDELVMYMHDVLERAGRTHFRHLDEVHSSLSEDLAFRRVLSLARHVEGARLYMMHVSAATGVEAIADYRSQGVAVTGETLPQYLLHTARDYDEPDGMKYHTYPSLKEAEDVATLWAGMEAGTITTLATDELCTSYDLKTAGRRIDNVVGGNTGVEPRLAVTFTEAVVRRGFTIGQFVDLTSTNAARVLGMYPQKGVIAVGSDADLAVLDTGVTRIVTATDLHESDYTPWEGWTVNAWPVATVLRGEVVVRDGLLLADRGGQLVRRQLGDIWV
jgi:dihydropyrimidinase